MRSRLPAGALRKVRRLLAWLVSREAAVTEADDSTARP